MNAIRMSVVKNYTTLVDSDIAKEFEGRRLCLCPNGYVRFYLFGKYIRLHRWIMKARPNDIVDHINGDRLNNTRKNLRIVTPSINGANRKHVNSPSGFRGLFHRPDGYVRQWKAHVMRNRITYSRNFINKHVGALFVDRTLRQFWTYPGYLNYPATIPSDCVTEIMDRSMGSWMKIVFSKKSNGRLREMTCRIMGLDQPPTPDAWKNDHGDLYFVWEKDQGIKAVPKERLLCLEVYDIKYVVERPRQTMQRQRRTAISSVRTATP